MKKGDFWDVLEEIGLLIIIAATLGLGLYAIYLLTVMIFTF